VSKRLFLVDLDLTLIDAKYRPTIPADLFISRISKTISDGDIIGLISDSPYETLAYWMDVFCFKGPIVAEKGACVVWEDGNIQGTIQKKVDWDAVKEEIIAALQQEFPSGYIREENYLALFQEEKPLLSGCDVVMLISPFRRFGFCIHIRRVGQDGILEQDERLFNHANQVIMRVVGEMQILSWLDVDSNPLYSVTILADNRVEKFLAIPVLRRRYPDHQIIVIGDGNSDALLKGHADILCAVGNATDQLKKAADIIAQKDITEGVIEILEIMNEKIEKGEIS